MNEGDMYPIFQGKCKIKKSTRANDKKNTSYKVELKYLALKISFHILLNKPLNDIKSFINT